MAWTGKPPIPPLPPEIAKEIRFGTLFNREAPVVKGEMMPYLTGKHYLSTKQVPTALALRRTGSSTLKKRVGTVVDLGFRVVGKDLRSDVDELITYSRDAQNGDQINIERETDGSVNSWSYELKSLDYEYPMKHNVYRMEYEDFFKVIAGRFLARELGKDIPELLVWPGDGISLTGTIPGHVLGSLVTWKGSQKNGIRFTEIMGPEIKLELILRRTHWGVRLEELIRTANKAVQGETEEARASRLATLQWGKLLKRRLSDFLSGYPDPLWSTWKDKVYATPGKHSEKHRAGRLLELLKTIDGIFLQCYIAVPEGDWTWEKFDLTVLKNLSAMIGDEFFDGDVTETYYNVVTRYTELKRARKTFKRLSNLSMLEKALEGGNEGNLVAPWLRFLLPIWKYTRGRKDAVQLAYVDSVLCQTRGAGQPPDLVKMQSKRKFISTISTEPEPLTGTEKSVLKAAIQELDGQLDPEIFTGLDTKARVTLNANACWEKTQQEGGTLEAIAEIVTTGQSGTVAYIRDLFSGEITESVYLQEVSTGTYVFWRCLDTVLRSNPAEIRQAALVMISEPGKARTVTKASAALKVVLDVVNKICSHPLGKIKSSASGMHKASHAWNSFRSGWTEEGKSYVFAEQARSTKSHPDGTRTVEKTYRDLWMSSTDYSEATDKLRHEVARPIAEYWMRKCGIPPILKMIVKGTCFAPRPVVFEAYGPMASYGDEWTRESPFQEPRYVMLRQGVLMGDPLTKVCLHLVNILVRIVGEKYSSQSFIQKVFPFESTEVAAYLRKYVEDPAPPQFQYEAEEENTPNHGVGSGKASTEAPTLDEPITVTQTSIGVTVKEEKPLPMTVSPKQERKALARESAKPLDFVLTDNWLRKPVKIDLQTQNGYVRAEAHVPKLNVPREPSRARQFTFRSTEVKNVLAAANDRHETVRIAEESATRMKQLEGFKWNFPEAAVTPADSRTPVRQNANSNKNAYLLAKAAGAVPVTQASEAEEVSTCSVS